MPANKDLIIAKNISVEFKIGEDIISPLKDVSFTLSEKSFNIIYGPSGSGKSTLLNVLTGLQHPSKGSVMFAGNNMYELKPDDLAKFRANDIGFVYQSNYWIKSLTALENVAVPLYFLGFTRAEAFKRAHEALKRVNMDDYAKKNPQLMSGGEQQRIAIARALSSNPSFIIADEPTGALDSKTGDFIMSLLEQCETDFGQTVVLVTHNMEYLPLADSLLHIEDGHVVEMPSSSIQATADKLLREMRDRIHRLSEAKHGK
ncbi:MAG: ABC transporter ATP-binding protein [Candidatus Nomurabacteria bacterium]|nr:MAG: ABC transporter ATP-binding protein [Candidatus Nomurabacteria bacterium]